MKAFSRSNRIHLLFFNFAILLAIFITMSCRRLPDNPTIPTKFTDLKVDASFEFQNFNNLDLTVLVPSTKASGVNIIQVYSGDPGVNGRVIMSGALNSNNEFRTIIRLPSNTTEVYIGKLNSDGNNEYVAVPVVGNTITYDFGKTGGQIKSASEAASNDCSTGCTSTVSGTQNNLTILSGQTVCVTASATFNSLTINSGGTLRICGTATVNSMSATNGTIIVTPSGTLNLPKTDFDLTINNYGNLSLSGCGTIDYEGILNNWGNITTENKFIIKGTVTNNGTFTVNNELTINSGGNLINNCSFYVTSFSNNAFNQNNLLTNNKYLKVNGDINLSGNTTTTLGLQSLIESKDFDIEGTVNGPSSQGSQIKASHEGKTTGGCYLNGYVDLCAPSIEPDNGHYGQNGTKCAYTIPVPTCNNPTPPVITSSLQIAGQVNQPLTSYVITATGTEPITYNATDLPGGLTYNSSTHTISGTPTSVGVTNVTLTAENMMGTDTKTLVITIAQPPSPPIITSALTASTTVYMPFTYEITATGATPITYNATNLPAGLSFDSNTHKITGNPSAAGVYNITLTAANSVGTDTKTLVLTVGAPPLITSALTATGTVGTQFSTYTMTATGTGPITYTATGLPPGLSFDLASHTITGTPLVAGVTNVTITATNAYGSDVKTLVITINEALNPPVITSPLTATAVKNTPFTYIITATGTQPITFNATNLPPGLTFNGNTISGIPTIVGNTNVTLTATNSVGTDTKTLVIHVVFAPGQDTDGDGVPDNLDAYPTDPTRAFNSFYPNEVDYGTFVFEDLWPGYGDYDCNDLVVNFNYTIVTNAQNKVVDVVAKLKIKAAGASMNNGFGMVFQTSSANVASVTGCIKAGSSVIIDPKGFEAGHTNNTVIIPFDAVNTILGNGMVNTIKGGPVVQTEIQTVTVHFQTPQETIGTPPFNPFIFADQERGKEIHLKDQPPTDLVNPIYFGTFDDASNPAMNFYYRSKTALPWAFEIPVDFSYPVETVDILQTYLHFAEWAQSSGAVYTDWYMDKPGYRNAANVY